MDRLTEEARNALKLGDIAARAATKIVRGWPLEHKEVKGIVGVALLEATGAEPSGPLTEEKLLGAVRAHIAEHGSDPRLVAVGDGTTQLIAHRILGTQVGVVLDYDLGQGAWEVRA
ncbi:MAG TPA: hypothetical protein VF192_01385 [Longimicrobiales bacterium]